MNTPSQTGTVFSATATQCCSNGQPAVAHLIRDCRSRTTISAQIGENRNNSGGPTRCQSSSLLANRAENATLATIAIIAEIGLASVACVELRISMQTRRIRFTTAAIAVAAILASGFSHAARVGVLSNNHA